MDADEQLKKQAREITNKYLDRTCNKIKSHRYAEIAAHVHATVIFTLRSL